MRTTMKHFSLIALALSALPAWAHPGHGAGAGLHWHAVDAIGPLALVVAVAAGLWWARRK